MAGIQVARMIAMMTRTSSTFRTTHIHFFIFASQDIGDDFVFEGQADGLDEGIGGVDSAIIVEPGIGMGFAKAGPETEQIADETVDFHIGTTPGAGGVEFFAEDGETHSDGAIAVAPEPLPGAGVFAAIGDDGDIGGMTDGGGDFLSGI